MSKKAKKTPTGVDYLAVAVCEARVEDARHLHSDEQGKLCSFHYTGPPQPAYMALDMRGDEQCDVVYYLCSGCHYYLKKQVELHRLDAAAGGA